jgi:hypothetical protein
MDGYFFLIESISETLYDAGPGFLLLIIIPFGELPIVAIGERCFYEFVGE